MFNYKSFDSFRVRTLKFFVLLFEIRRYFRLFSLCNPSSDVEYPCIMSAGERERTASCPYSVVLYGVSAIHKLVARQ